MKGKHIPLGGLNSQNQSNKMQSLRVLPHELFSSFMEVVPIGMKEAFEQLKDAEVSTETFSFYTSVSAMASSKIEGEALEIDSYIKHKMLNVSYLEDLVQKPNDLYDAYRFAQAQRLTRDQFLEAHRKLSRHLLEASARGELRKSHMVVMEHKTLRIQYEAAPAHLVASAFDALWADVEVLLDERLSIEQCFFYAALLHLVFVNIHPFEDGNGRAGRLLEKWFLAEKLGPKAWFLQSELYYYQNVSQYYSHLNKLGLFYDQLDYGKALPFLLMLPQSLFLAQHD